ncbi:MAG: RimK family alpha-L-glutamate ligase [Candidatus Lokiarchaeota archaeon]
MNSIIIITPNPEDPEIKILTQKLQTRNFTSNYFIPSRFSVKLSNFEEEFADLDPYAALVRGFGVAPTQKIFFRLDILRALEEIGITLINSREALEIASDKFLTSIFLNKHGIPTPETVICEHSYDALQAFDHLGKDVVLKPLFGSKGIGITRLNDKAFAENVIYSLERLNEVFYLQEFIEHYNRDIRVLVLGNKAIAGMYRISDNWKTNIHAGAKMKPLMLTEELKSLAIEAAKVVRTEIAGVDIIESERGYMVIEVNSIPGFTALDKVTEIDIPGKIIDYFIERTKNK